MLDVLRNKSYGSSLLLIVIAHLSSPCVAQDKTSLGYILFSGINSDTTSTFVHAGGKISLAISSTKVFALNTSGFSSSDYHRMRRSKLNVQSINAKSQLFLGFEQSYGPVFIATGLGPSLARFVDRHNLTKTRAGAALYADVWYRPDERQLLTATMIADTSSDAIWSRMRYGWRTPFATGYAGPELAISRDNSSRKLQVGAQLSEWKLWFFTTTIAAGFSHNGRKKGPYASLSSYVGF